MNKIYFPRLASKNFYFWQVVSIFCLAFFNCVIVSANQLYSIKTGAYQAGTRLVMVLASEPDYRYFKLYEPARFVLDFKSTRVKKPLSMAQDLQRLPGFSLHLGHRRASDLRLVLETKTSTVARHFVLAPDRDHTHYRLIIDFTKPLVAKHAKESQGPTLKAPWIGQLRDVVVLIDPGHGGKDPGAVGRYHSREKDVVLAIAKQLLVLIRHETGIRAVLTRHSDHYLTLRQRLSKARSQKADLFVSIHADAYRDRSARGASVYALSERGATSEAARWLAAKENYSELGGVNLHDKSNLLRSVLLDLSQTATISASLALGKSVLKELKQVTRLHRHRVEQAPFVVLKSPDIPSILVETGFISNAKEERLLRTRRHQQHVAQALFRGIKNYLLTHPVIGTHLAQKRIVRHLVKRGETLSGIAKRYGLSMASIRKTNALPSSSLNEGQILVLPLTGRR